MKLLKNTTDSDIILLGKAIPAHDERDYTDIPAAQFATSNEFVTYIGNGSLVGSDGTKDLSPAETINYFCDYYQKFLTTSDNRLVSQATPRPLGQYSYFTGASDNIETGERGAGEHIYVQNVVDTASKSVDIYILDSSWSVREGYIAWKNGSKSPAGKVDNIDLMIYCSANELEDGTGLTLDPDYRIRYDAAGTKKLKNALPYVVPNKTGEGWWNYSATSDLTPAAGNGSYDMYAVDVPLFRFANKILCYGNSGYPIRIESNDSERMYPGYYLKFITHNESNTDWEAWGWLVLYRTQTLGVAS